MAKKKYRGPPPSFRRRPDPDAGWNAPPVDRAGALQRAARILKQLEKADKAIWRKAMDFFSDVEEKVTRIRDDLAQGGLCSSQTDTALKNWEIGIGKWLRPKAGEAPVTDEEPDTVEHVTEGEVAADENGGDVDYEPPAEEQSDEFA